MLVESRRVTWTEVATLMSITDVLDMLDAVNCIVGMRNARQDSSDEEWDED